MPRRSEVIMRGAVCSREQPAIAYLGSSIDTSFPAILVFGREYNNNPANSVRGLGQYCFRCSPRSLFWNRTYRLVARLSGRDDFKATCIVRHESPIMFSNVLPRPIPNAASASEKRRLRAAISPDALVQHIDGIFSIDAVINRLHLIVLSGVDDAVFRSGVARIRQRCGKRGVSIAEIAYLGSRQRSDALEASFPNRHRARIRAAITSFYQARRNSKLQQTGCLRCLPPAAERGR